jgi:hypothetical protein
MYMGVVRVDISRRPDEPFLTLIRGEGFNGLFWREKVTGA